MVIEGNRVFDNGGTGINLGGYSEARGNEVWGQDDNGGVGITASGANTLAAGNTVWGSTTGLYALNSGRLEGNRSFANVTGISLGNSAEAWGNHVHGNSGVGLYLSSWQPYAHNNVIEGNGGAGILVSGAAISSDVPRVENNTVIATVADAIVVQGSNNVRIVNNILSVRGSGYALNVASDSQQGFKSDYNLFHLAAGAKLAYWEDRAFANRVDWFYEVGFDRNSLTADPRFVDEGGVDNLVGWNGSTVAGSVRVLDDGDAGYSTSGTWTPGPASGRGGDSQQAVRGAVQGEGSAQASWTFSGLSAGYYRIAVTWPALQGNDNPQGVYTAYDGQTAIGTAGYGQYWAASGGFAEGGTNWVNLGMVRIEGDTLKVVLDNLIGRTAADAIRIERVGGDFGADDNLHLQASSPAIDRGDPLSPSVAEGAPSGGRIDLGAYGNTAQATPSANPVIQVLGPNGLEKIEAGEPVTIDWRSAGLLPYDTVFLLDAGSNVGAGRWLAQGGYRLDPTNYVGSIAAGTAIDLSGVAGREAPDGVYRSYAYAPGGVGSKMAYQIPAADGQYEIVLHFIEPDNVAAGTRSFDIVVNGEVEAAGYDIRTAAGAIRTATTASFMVDAAGGAGINLELINKNASWGAVLSGIELRRLNPQGVANPVVSLEVSLDNGASWTTIATGLGVDRYGQGQTTWVPTAETAGNTALIRATATINPASGPVVVSDVSDEAFLIANGGKVYYVNDASLAGDEYTTAVGDNANSGKSADKPMASLAALLRAYDLNPGDIVHVDSGTYSLATNIVLGEQDSGVVIRGASQPGHATILDRGNTNAGTAVFEFQGADDVRIENVSLTGARIGVWAASGADSDRNTVAASKVYGFTQANTGYGFYIDTGNDAFTIQGSAVHGNRVGVWMSGAGGVIENSQIYGNSQWGIDAYGSTQAQAIQIRNNLVHDNASGGVQANNWVKVSHNEVYSHLTSNVYGISLISANAEASGNLVYRNDSGIYGQNGALIAGNQVFANTRVGIYGVDARISGNRVFSNAIGIHDNRDSLIENNVVYANANTGISVAGAHAAADMVRNNTVYQPVGDAILVTGTNVKLHNNIVWVDAGYGVNVAAGSTATLLADHNLFHTPLAGGRVGLWNGTQQATLAAWRTASGQDAHSLAGNPLFLDIDGADNVLGEKGLITGNGFDDNFGLRANSAAIDAANMYVATAADIEGRPRRDDPSRPNTGDGLPLYVATAGAGSSFVAGGTKLNYRTSDGSTNYTLPFAFTFYGKTYTQVAINVNGFLQFEGPDQSWYGNENSLEGLLRNVRIAPLWDNLNTYSGTDATRDVYADASVAGQVTIRWAAVVEGTANPVNFSVTLFANGSFRFDYGPSANGLTPTVGVSAGNGQTYVLAPYDGQSDLSGMASLTWAPTPGLVYYDIGAYEFQGDSSDATPPRVVSVSNLPADGGSTPAAFSSLQINFSEALDGVSARSPANYELLSAGVDGVFGTSDDSRIALKPGYSFPETNLTLQLPDGPLANGLYRLSVLGVFDTAGNTLDGNNDGTGGDSYVRTFRIDRTGNTPPTATDATTSVAEDGSILITLNGTDPNGDPLAFSLVGQPQHGTLTNFDPVARTVRYTPNAHFNGTDSFRFRVDDGNLGSDEGQVLVNVTPVNDVPTAAGVVTATDEDTAISILLPAQDVETPREQLTFNLGTAPQHGTLTQGADGVWVYTPDADFNGTDSFTYTVTDRGDPDGAGGNAATSAPATVTITVRALNDAPQIAAIPPQTVAEGQTLSLPIPGTDPDGSTLSYSLVGSVPGASINAATGLFSWTPADGALTQSFTVRVSDGTLSTEATFSVTVTNVAPALTVQGGASVNAGTPYAITFGATDPGQDTISAWVVNWGNGQTTTLAGGATGASFTYAQGGNYAITVTATDEDGSYTSAPLALHVVAPNGVPIAGNQSVTLDEDTPRAIVLSVADPDGDVLGFALTTAPLHGTLGAFDPATRTVLYTPAANYHGVDSFSYTVSDGRGGSASATVTIGVTPVNDAPVATDDAYTVTSGQTLTVPVLAGLLANDSDVDGDALVIVGSTAASHGAGTLLPDGSFSYTPTAGFVGTDSFSYTVSDGLSTRTATVSITVSAPPTLKVSTFTQTDSGFTLRFNRAVDASQLNLYTGDPTNLGAADLVLTGPDGKPVSGSLVLDADGAGLTFLRTGGVLASGSYSLSLASRANGFATADGILLDGNGDGTAGDAYLKTFTVAPSSSAVLSVGEIARGPGQALAIAASGFNFPITLDNAAGATRIAFTLRYDPALLNVTGFTGGTLPAGSTVSVDTSVAGQLTVSIVTTAPLGAGRIVLGNLAANVPADAAYGASHLLRLSQVQIDAGARPVRSDDGLHVVAYLGDTSGDAAYSATDVQRLQRVMNRTDTGYAAWPLVDPLLLSDVKADGVLSLADASLLNQQAAGRPQKEIPPIPAPLPTPSLARAAAVAPVAQAAPAASPAPQVAATPAFDFAGAPKAFDLGTSSGIWLDSWVSDAAKSSKKANAWTLTAAPKPSATPTNTH
ncbi:tandem-95 repeat protein [Aquabacterium soli]|uniref:Tandem-95 repeat protein n=1 Tax=Aquabacterium soli TaxID=2493092 RepID=A0A3R8U1Y6_9BURK|nr:Ig-like domain-containing protein [Aquabacterium soli]RRS02949.1 tandem-95 repeat protein [Aquabacterium soli]